MTSRMQPRDKIIPWYFVMFFVVVAAVNAVMVTLAVRTHTGIVTEHPYEKGLAYNAVVDAEAKQEALGWKGHIDYQKGAVRFTLRDAANHPVHIDTAIVRISRPTQAGMDFSVVLTGGATPIAFPQKGLWELRVDAIARGEQYQQAKRIVVE